MKDINEVLRQKEQLVHVKQMELEQLNKDIESLRVVRPMLIDDAERIPSEPARVAIPHGTPSAGSPSSKPSAIMAAGGNGIFTKAVSHETLTRWP